MFFGRRFARLGFSLRRIDIEHGVSDAILDANLVDRDVRPVALLLNAKGLERPPS